MSWLMWIAAVESAPNVAYFNVQSSVLGGKNLYSVHLIDALMLMQLWELMWRTEIQIAFKSEVGLLLYI